MSSVCIQYHNTWFVSWKVPLHSQQIVSSFIWFYFLEEFTLGLFLAGFNKSTTTTSARISFWAEANQNIAQLSIPSQTI